MKLKNVKSKSTRVILVLNQPVNFGEKFSVI